MQQIRVRLPHSRFPQLLPLRRRHACSSPRAARSCGSLYLHAASHPIIEHCFSLRIAPYPELPPPLDGAIAAAGLRAELNQWNLVDDFDWLKQSQSPNWSVIDEAQRYGAVHFAQKLA